MRKFKMNTGIKATKPYVSPKQQSVLDFISDHLVRFGYSPTQEEVAKGCSMSRTLAMYHIRQLCRKKLVDKRGRSRRNLVIKSY